MEAAQDSVVLSGHPTDLVAHVRALLQAYDSWRIEHGELWCSARQTGFAEPEQGWKLHISATPASAWAVLDRAVPVLRSRNVSFTFAKSLDGVRWITGRECGRADSGKFLTVYPRDDAQFVVLAKELDIVTDGLAGPRVLSDRPCRPGSIVHYRYGGFHDVRALDDDGVYRHLLTGPDGSVVADRREVWSTPPAWAPCPLPDDTPAGGPALLANRFSIRTAVRQSAKGGVYLAADQRDERDVVIKHGRAHAEADLAGLDVRDRLRHEATLLGVLAALVPVPRVLDVLSQEDDLFLVEELLPGEPLRYWVQQRSAGLAAVPARPAADLARGLVSLLGEVHGAGVVLRDLSPTNILVTDDGVPQLVDLEIATEAGQLARRAATTGYAAPELRTGPDEVSADPTEDLFGLGALLFLIATGNDPVLPADEPPDRAPVDRIAGWLQVVADADETARMLAPAILGLMAQDPAERWSLADAEAYLAWQPIPMSVGRPAVPPVPRPVSPDRLLTDGIDALLATMTPRQDRLWASGPVGSQTDPANVQNGAAGVLCVLVAALRASGDSGRLAGAARGAAHWLSRHSHHAGTERLLPGLCFGRAGTAWALAEAGSVLGEPDLVEQGCALALRLPTRWPNPGVAHGLAGAGMAHLRLWRHTGDGRLLDRAAGYADAVVAAARPDRRGVPLWPIPADSASLLAGSCHYGFAHGAAGIGYFLLAAGQATGRSAYVELAVAAGSGLADVADVDPRGAAWWPVGPAEPTRLPDWCSGSSGIGTFLLRLAGVAPDPRFAELAAGAAVAVHDARWASMPSACHGLAGNGQFLLDAAASLDDDRYRSWARDLADLIAVRHCRRDGLLLVPDETGQAIVADYGVGSAGVLAFLLRLRHGGPRPWLLDDLLDGRVTTC